MHIDGEFLICAGILGEKTHALPIYKKYTGYDLFRIKERMHYVLDVLRIMMRFRKGYYRNIFVDESGHTADCEFDVISSY